jgi:hypothetical protein
MKKLKLTTKLPWQWGVRLPPYEYEETTGLCFITSFIPGLKFFGAFLLVRVPQARYLNRPELQV